MTKETDRELLELAAKANGHGVEFDSVTGLSWYENKFSALIWNPLHHDADALRLAVACRIDIHQDPTQVSCDSKYQGHVWEVHDGKNACAATRRAIVRAAAEIGKSMP